MRVALISDVHGNLPALEAALTDIERAEPDRVVNLGDVAAMGPQPHETIARLRAVGYSTVLGNTDDKLLERAVALSEHGATDGSDSSMPGELDEARRIQERSDWTARQLTAEDQAYMRSFVPTLTLDLGEGQILLCCHGSPCSYTDLIRATTPDADLATMLGEAPAEQRATLIVGGHTHIQMVRRYRSLTLLNPGSVGFPMTPGALPGHYLLLRHVEYAILEQADGALRIELRRVAYDTQAVVDAYYASGMPHAEWSAADWR